MRIDPQRFTARSEKRSAGPNAAPVAESACGMSRTRPLKEAVPTTHLASDNLYNVIYRVDKASNAQLARLESCLQKYPSVLGVDIQTPGGS